MKTKKLSTAAKIRGLLNNGETPIKIAKKLKVTPAYVYVIKSQMTKAKKKAQFKSPRSRLIQDIYQLKNALNVIEKPTKLLVQPQHKDAALEILADNDLVNHPPHYKAGGIETIDFIETKDLNYRLGNVVKYVSRAGKKEGSDPVEDLEKAAWYLQREIDARKKA